MNDLYLVTWPHGTLQNLLASLIINLYFKDSFKLTINEKTVDPNATSIEYRSKYLEPVTPDSALAKPYEYTAWKVKDGYQDIPYIANILPNNDYSSVYEYFLPNYPKLTHFIVTFKPEEYYEVLFNHYFKKIIYSPAEENNTFWETYNSCISNEQIKIDHPITTLSELTYQQNAVVLKDFMSKYDYHLNYFKTTDVPDGVSVQEVKYHDLMKEPMTIIKMLESITKKQADESTIAWYNNYLNLQKAFEARYPFMRIELP